MELDALGMVAVFFTAIAATVLGTMSGGGLEIIMYPVFISLGIPIPIIISTAFTTNVFWTMPAAYNYLKGRKVDWMFVLLFSGIGLIGCYLGIAAILTVQPRIYQICIGVIILLFVVYLYFNKDIGLQEKREYSKSRGIYAYPFALVMGFYELILGVGNAIALSILTFYTRGFDFIDGLGHYYLIVLPWSIFSAAFLISKGYFDIQLAILAILGSMVGAYIGSRYARYKGNKFIKTLFVIVGGILGLKLLLGF
ncbi:hypothetical protein A2851_03130 [Candidatus Kaiserbacteria bacterium RIFCSPHIGHO2_01_FULL_53_29]|uniref:Probable membrane transporter protein n=1 Tax=Candidatus Kaiserbacteria bacterium RIFCSPHIGHO2_01_FULL_53_29 TaxID=1798480 RepID=A0A1F6CV88_9BACT|nr:MAG: hypothetical protein A2851_03130 [Candidatus Kaiserbacteria bacterium RIFCSPHIGHO2_01_FULL_53_29]